MRYIDEFRNENIIKRISRKIKEINPPTDINIMEVCGTHTQSFFRFGLDKLLPQNINLISGPGCPVCVSTEEYIDKAVLYAKQKDAMIITFGDMLRVPGSESSLEKERANGADITVVYSCLDSLKIAKARMHKKVIFLAVGFETTAPTIALTLLMAKREGLKNLFFFSSLKLIPAAMAHLLKDERINVSGFLLPGHVCAIIGTKPYEFIPKRYKIGCCIAGFEPLDILEGIYFLLKQIANKKPAVENQYMRVVTESGNLKAKRTLSSVFKTTDAYWRGIGKIEKSGLRIRQEFSLFDAEKVMPVKIRNKENKRRDICRCGDVIKGIIKPPQCVLFSRICNPDNPLGPCMVSSEGTCNAYYRYK